MEEVLEPGGKYSIYQFGVFPFLQNFAIIFHHLKVQHVALKKWVLGIWYDSWECICS